MLQPLESRTMLASVTVIAHGWEPTGKVSGWVGAMSSAISARTEAGADVYRVTIRGTGDDARVGSFKRVSAAKGAGPSGDAVVIVDWAAASAIDFSLLLPIGRTSSTRVAQLVAPLLLSAQPGVVRSGRPLAELPIHLIGHSRGASLVSELAKELGRSGVWVDQLTTLDARPITNDPSARAWSNVLFADNYRQRVDTFILQGQSVDGARTTDLSGVFADLTSFGVAHNRVQTYYGGTVNPAARSFGGAGIRDAWFATTNTGPRETKGFAWARGGDEQTSRPGSGLRFAGADRSSLSVSATGAARVDSAAITSLNTAGFVERGELFPLEVKLEDANGDAAVTLSLDTDANPYNGTGTVVAEYSPSAETGRGVVTLNPSVDTRDVPVGKYHVVATVSNGVNTQYAYALRPLTVLPDGTSDPARVVTVQAGKPATYLDGSGRKVSVKLSGPGTGTLVLPGLSGPADLSLMNLSGSTEQTALTLSGNTRVGTIDIGGPAKSVSAKGVELTGGLSVLGAVRTVSVRALSGATLRLEGGAMSVVVGSATGARLLAGFRPDTTADSGRGALTGPAVLLRSVNVRGVFSGTLLAAGSLGTVRLGVPDPAAPSTVLTTSVTQLSTSKPRSSLASPDLGDMDVVPGLRVRVI